MPAKRKIRLVTLEEQIELMQLSLPELGPVVVPSATVPPKRPPSGGRVPYERALRHIVRAVIRNLEEHGEQWDDEAKQDLVSTLFIAAHREKRIAFDFDQEAA